MQLFDALFPGKVPLNKATCTSRFCFCFCFLYFVFVFVFVFVLFDELNITTHNTNNTNYTNHMKFTANKRVTVRRTSPCCKTSLTSVKSNVLYQVLVLFLYFFISLFLYFFISLFLYFLISLFLCFFISLFHFQSQHNLLIPPIAIVYLYLYFVFVQRKSVKGISKPTTSYYNGSLVSWSMHPVAFICDMMA